MPLPSPKKGEGQSDFISRCVSFVKSEDPNTPNDQAVAMCGTQFRNSKKSNQKMESLKLNYSVPIKESFSEDGDFIIEGTAINATTTDNGHTFLVEELRPSASSLTGVPLLVDHDALVENIKGRVIIGEFNEAEEKIDFKARVVDEKIKKLIKDGLLNTVSVGANVKEIQEGENGNLIARGIKFKELSLVATPADDGATFGIAMSEAYKSQVDESQNTTQSYDTKESDSEPEENLQELKGGSENIMETNNDKIVLEAIEDMKKSLSEKLDEKIEAVEKSFSEKLEALKESDADEEVEKEVVEEEEKSEEEATEEEVEEEEEEEEKAEESTGLDIVEGNGSLRGNSFSYNW